MKILQLSPTDSEGGASKVAMSLSEGLIAQGVEVDFAVNRKNTNRDWVHPLPAYKTEHGVLLGKVFHRLGWDGLNLHSEFPKTLAHPYFERYDLIHIHDLPASFNLSHFRWLSRRVPVVWSIHSMQPFTGNCSYAYDCEGWKDTCGDCPQFGEWPLHWLHRDGSRAVQQLKQWIYQLSNLHFIGVGDWISSCLQASRTCRKLPVYTIPNAINPKDFYPENRSEARQRLGIPEDAFVVMFSVSGNSRDTRKGFDMIVDALCDDIMPPVFLLPTGITKIDDQMDDRLTSFPGLPPRHFTAANNLRDYYNAADVVWHPSRADNAPLTLLESMACGTPVIAANVGGVKDIIKSGQNGILIRSVDSRALAEATRDLMNNTELQHSLAERLRNLDETVSKWDRFIASHMELYAGLIRDQESWG
jgi:glycosyltransferase involved in cell wall biosynthesis